MAKHFMIFVIDDLTASGTPEEMVNIDAFNDKLREKGHWVFAGGLSAPSHGNVIDHRKQANVSTGQPLFNAPENYSGFWLIKADDLDTATRLAFEGSHACNRRVELRPLL
jgi:hypothetical protein